MVSVLVRNLVLTYEGFVSFRYFCLFVVVVFCRCKMRCSDDDDEVLLNVFRFQ